MGIFSKKKEEEKEIFSEKSEKADIAQDILPKSEQVSKFQKDNKLKKTASTKKPAKKIGAAKSILAEKIIVRPWVSEKASAMMSRGVYTFKIAGNASKNLVKDLIESLYDVEVRNVNVINTKGKLKNFKGKSAHRSNNRKAVVSLKSGQKIEELTV